MLWAAASLTVENPLPGSLGSGILVPLPHPKHGMAPPETRHPHRTVGIRAPETRHPTPLFRLMCRAIHPTRQENP